MCTRLLLCLSTLLLLAGIALADPEYLRCPRPTKAVLIDGQLDEWSDAGSLAFGDTAQIVLGADKWSGKSDCSGRLLAMWDSTSLYLAAEITDDAVVGLAGSHSSHHNDGIEIHLDTDLESDWQEVSYDADDAQFMLCVHSDGKPTVWCFQHMREEVPGAKIAMTRTSAGYILEASIPWSAYNVKPKPGKWLGFGAVLDDDDDPAMGGQQCCLAWPAHSSMWLNPTEMGRMVLVSEPSDEVKQPVLKPLSDAPLPILVEASNRTGSLPRLWEGVGEGGETDPYMFESVTDRMRDIGTKLVRVDHILNRYGAYPSRGEYAWANLDRLVDSITAAGAKPLMCLSYIPAGWLSGGPDWSPLNSYADWEEVVYQTVKHFNVDRKLGIEYWEVWNEPDAGNFWRGTFEDYLELYDAAERGALRADPKIKFGGPGVSWPIKGWISGLMKHCAENKRRLDFVSWHSYDIQPELHSTFIRQVRKWASEYPSLHPELIIDEWNAGGGLDARNDAEYDAAFAAAALCQMIDAGLGKSCFFEMRDGKGSERFWGRWGLLTYDGTPKPVYNAFRMFSMLGRDRLRVGMGDPYVGALAARADDEVSVLLWNLDLRATPKDRDVKLRVEGLPRAFMKCERYVIDSTRSNARYDPAHAELEVESAFDVGSSGVFETAITVKHPSVVLYRFIRKQ